MFGSFWKSICLVLVGVILGLVIRLYGLPFVGGGLIKKLETTEFLRHAEAQSHRKTKENYRSAVREAARMDAARLARVKSESDMEDLRAKESFNSRVAALRAKHDRMLLESRARIAGSSGGVGVPALPTPSFGTDEEADSYGLSFAERLECSVNSTQLDDLIVNIENKAKALNQ